MMKKIIAILVLAIPFCFPVFGQAALEKNILDNKLEMLLPRGFTPMTKEMIASRPSVVPYQPGWAITGDNGRIILSYMHTDHFADDNGIPGFTDELIAAVRTRGKDVKLLDDGILLEDGKNIGFIKFLSRDNGERTFHYMFYLSLQDRLLLFDLSGPNKLKKKWEERAAQMAASIRLLPRAPVVR